jgi:GNAT superfamily N-acetyltransferase
MSATEALLRIRRYDAGWSDHAALSEGTRVVLRPLGPGDAGRIAAAFARLSKRTRALRFLGGKAEMSPAELRYLSDVDGEMHFAIAACQEDAPDEIIGIARFLRFDQDPARAEVAATVADAFQGRGLGRLLLTRLAEAARERGVRTFHCELAEGNTPALGLVSEAAPGLWTACSEDGVVVVDVPLPPEPRR